MASRQPAEPAPLPWWSSADPTAPADGGLGSPGAVACALLPPLVVGAVLRLWSLRAQVLADDELHAVRAALQMPLGEVLSTYQLLDNSIPLTALFRFLLGAGVRLDEMGFRLPSVAAGLLLLPLAGWWAWRRGGGLLAATLCWLLATSPLLVFYSRIARSYLPMVLCSAIAVAAFDAWWRRPARRAALAYALAAALAVWFHLGAATFVAGPLVFAALALSSRWDAARARSVVALAALLAVTTLVLLVPALPTLFELLRAKHQPLAVTWAELGRVAGLLAGSRHPWLAAGFFLLAGLGLARLARRAPVLAGVSAAAVSSHLVGILVMAPAEHENALVLARYLLVTLPCFALWVATAVAAVPGRVLRYLPAVALLVALVAGGPFLDPTLRRSSFAHHWDRMAFVDDRPRAAVAPCYAAVAERPGDGSLVEHPWFPMWRVSRAFDLAQESHRRPVKVSPARALLLLDPRLAWRHVVAPSPTALLASDARFVVVHRDLGWEELASAELPSFDQRRVIAHFRPRMLVAGERMAAELERAWGSAHCSDGTVALWDLERVRAARP